MRTRDAALAVNYSQQARDCACGCGGGCLHTAVRTAARDAVMRVIDTWSPAAREAAARARAAHHKEGNRLTKLANGHKARGDHALANRTMAAAREHYNKAEKLKAA